MSPFLSTSSWSAKRSPPAVSSHSGCLACSTYTNVATRSTSPCCVSGDATHLSKPAHQLLYQIATFCLAPSTSAVRRRSYLPLLSTFLAVLMLLSQPPTYVEVFSSSPAPHCSVLSLQASPIPSTLSHFVAFLLAAFDMKSH